MIDLAQDIAFMRRAISLARLGLANTAPNPRVGAVVVHDGRIIGEGFHRRIGEGHAEVNAISSVKPVDVALLRDATIYVTLEPCSHYGKTPPCAKLIIDKGLRRVVVGSRDPSPKVNGRGIAMLRDAGIEVTVLGGDISEQCRALNPEFNSRYVNSRPLITLKWAETADGAMANADGAPISVSTPVTSTFVHRLRARHDVILTTSATVIADNPRLDTRFWNTGNAPLRAVIDRHGKIPADANIFKNDFRKTLYFTLNYRDDLPNAEQIILPECEDRLSESQLRTVIDEIASRGSNSILVEAGPTFLQAMLSAGLYDNLRIERNNALFCPDGIKSPDVTGLKNRFEHFALRNSKSVIYTLST